MLLFLASSSAVSKTMIPLLSFHEALVLSLPTKALFSVWCAAKFIYSSDNNRISVIVSTPLPRVCLTASVCVAVFSGTCTVRLPRGETHVNTPVRPRPSMTM